MFGMMLICVGVMLLVSGIVIVDRHRAKAMDARRLLAIPQTAIANTVHDGALRVDGVVVPSGDGTLVAPCSGRSVVWFRVRLRRMVGGTGGSGEGGGGELWATVAEESDGKPFLVDDGSGTRALVRRVNRALISNPSRFERMSADAMERANAFLALRGHTDSSGIFEEECLASGDRVAVSGYTHKEPCTGEPVTYRDGGHHLVFDANETVDVIIANPTALRDAQRGAYLVGRVALAVGVLLVVLGLVVRHFGWELPAAVG